ncbi:hypothetical protein [Nonomuraea jabiensis]|uniref:hypothetical protein n=1 Tax=Nonomuraea jabiensis TaxID=882448 RepID=UPI003D73E2BB
MDGAYPHGWTDTVTPERIRGPSKASQPSIRTHALICLLLTPAAPSLAGIALPADTHVGAQNEGELGRVHEDIAERHSS